MIKPAVRQRVYKILEKAEGRAGTLSGCFLIALICLNVAEVIAGSFNTVYDSHRRLFVYFEYFSIAVFTVEYLLRMWSAAPNKFPNSKIPYVRYAVSFMALVDLCAILPFYLPFVVNLDLRVIRSLRLFRLIRIFKLTRYNNSLELLGKVLKKEKDKLILTISIAVVLLIMASSVMYYVENMAQPDKFPSIPATLWWAVATLTTVGYGDVYPVTFLGKMISGIIAITGMGLIALPSGIIGSGLVECREKERKKKGKNKRKRVYRTGKNYKKQRFNPRTP